MLRKNELIKNNGVEYAKFEIETMKKMKHPNLLEIDYVI